MPRHVAVLLAVLGLSGFRTAGADGLHAVGRVRPVEPGPAISIALLSGYGYTGAVLREGDAHHRAQGTVAAAVRALPWLELGGALTGRYDKHTGLETDDGMVGDPRLWVTAGGGLGGGRALGLRVGVWLPGADAPSVEWDAVSVDASAVLTLAPGPTSVTATGGFRFDRSTATVDATTLSRADRLGLGLSDANAVVLGLGVTHRAGPWQALGEVSGDLLVGAGAPEASESPWRVGAGARRALDRAFTLEAIVEVAASARPALDPMVPGALVAIEPRVTIGVGLSWHPAPAPRRVPLATHDDVVIAPPPLPPPAPTTGSIRGTVVDELGAPLPNAEVTVRATTVESGDDGGFVIPDVIAGELDVTSSREGYQPDQRKVTVTAGAEAPLAITLVRIRPPSQIRGLIRGFDGKGLAAKVHIEPLGRDVTAGADGRFTVDLPPGKYTIEITMPGYKPQQKSFEIEAEGVFQPNIELQKARR